MNNEEQAAYDKALKRIEECREQGKQGMRLDLSQLGLTTLPPEIGQLTALTRLDLRNNRLTTLPPEIGHLSALTRLSLFNNELTTLPPEIGQLSALTELDLSSNRLTTLPPQIGQLSALTWLSLSNNRLTTLRPEIGQLSALTELDLSSNRLTTLSPQVSHLLALTRLDLSNNQLTMLPPQIGQLSALTWLSLSNNQLTTLPPQIGQLSALTTLSLSSNQLTTLPPQIGQLSVLTELDLSVNQLTTLPLQIGQLLALKRLDLHGTAGLGIPEDALGPTLDDVIQQGAKSKPPKEILDYYFTTRDGEGVALREMKLVVVGWGKAGKTTLVKRLAREPMDPNERETHGIMIRPLTLGCTDGKLQARVWDFGGQHVLHAMHEFFLTARSLYLLVLEQRSDRAETDAKYWLQLIRSYAPQAPVVVALNKSRGVERPLDRESLEKMYGPIVAWIPTECLPETDCPGAEKTILKLREALTVAAEKRWIPEPRKLFPRKWMAIKGWLEGLDKAGINYLNYETFAHECASRGESDERKQADVAALMHDLGVAMNYARDERLRDTEMLQPGASASDIDAVLHSNLLRDERLRDTTVLRPDWLANGIYAVLRANLMLPGRPLVPDAVLTPEKLGEIYSVAAQEPVKMLKAADYPMEKWNFLLRLMNRFQLCFPLNEEGSQQLCPMLLHVGPPPGTDEPQGDDVVRLRYECPVLPAPFVPRFIVRVFPLIQKNMLWQRGVVLRYSNALARVWTTAEEKYLFVTASGPEIDRADLLDIIRGVLAGIFREYRGLQVTEQLFYDGHWVPRATLVKFGALAPEKGGHAEGEKVV